MRRQGAQLFVRPVTLKTKHRSSHTPAQCMTLQKHDWVLVLKRTRAEGTPERLSL